MKINDTEAQLVKQITDLVNLIHCRDNKIEIMKYVYGKIRSQDNNWDHISDIKEDFDFILDKNYFDTRYFPHDNITN